MAYTTNNLFAPIYATESCSTCQIEESALLREISSSAIGALDEINLIKWNGKLLQMAIETYDNGQIDQEEKLDRMLMLLEQFQMMMNMHIEETEGNIEAIRKLLHMASR